MQANSPKIKVLFIPKWYPNKYDPMPGLFIKRHAEAVSGFCEVRVLYIHPDGQHQMQKSIITNTVENGISTLRIYYKKTGSFIPGWATVKNAILYFHHAFRGIRIIKKSGFHPDLIHVNVLTRIGIIAWVYRMFTNTPYVITEHWTRYLPSVNSFKGYFRKKFTRIVVKQAKAVMPVTGNLKNAMQSFGLKNDHYIVVPNVVDTKLFRPFAEKEAGIKKRIVHVSCFTDIQKNISGILRVIKKLSEMRNDFELHLIGNGEDFEKIKQLSDQYNLTGRFIIFKGLLQGEELARAIGTSDLMILFSHYENLPVVIPESFACGVPVISSDVGGIHEHLGANQGALIKAGDEDLFLKTLNDHLDHLSRFPKNEIRQYALEHFSNEVIGQELFKIYSSIKNYKF